MPRWLKVAQRVLAALLGALVVVASITPALTSNVWWIRAFDFPRMQALVLAIVAVPACFFALRGQWRWRWLAASVMGLCVAAQATKIVPYTPLFPKQVQPARSGESGGELSLLVANVKMENRDSAAFLEAVRSRDPDVIAVVEPDAWWQEQLESLQASHPHTVFAPRDNTYGMLVYSRLRLTNARVEHIVQDDVPSIHARAWLPNGYSVDLHFLHPRPPAPQEATDTKERDAEILIVGKRVEDRSRPAIVAGDLNDVAWSSTTSLFQEISGLLDPRIGRGMFNSYHAKHWFLRWPLDHVFHSEHFYLVAMERLEAIGSDHFPIFIRLQLDASAPRNQEGPEASAEEEATAQEMIDKAER